MVKKILLVIFLLLVTCYLLPKLAFAQEFATSYDVLYDVGADGVTTVTEKITLKNLTSEYYANQFKLTIGATQVSDIKASDEGGQLEVQTEQKDTSTIINVVFNQQIVGKDKKLNWTLQFKSKDFATKLGKVWEITAPKVSSTPSLENYNLTISVPTQFGEPTLISPTPKSQTTSFNKRFLTFEKGQLLSSGVSGSFGINQLFDFDLSYHLENNNLVPILTNIALPPDTAYQDIVYQRIEPKPINVTVDDDGNFLAWYKLGRNQRLDIKVLGSARLYSSSKVKNPRLEQTLRNKYTASDKYWDSTHPQIQNKLAEILGQDPPQEPSEKIRLIYRYVVDSLRYDSSRLNGNIERLGALTALSSDVGAVCMEFTDLFIALSRAAGIPARELNGYAYTQNSTLRPLSLNKDILHSWPEYWDEKRGWIMVDPTWENTTGGVDYFNKLDLNHFVFVTKGTSSIQPIPAGSYKYIDEDSQDVKVNFSENDFLGKANLDVLIENPNPILAGFPGKIKVVISNVGNTFYPSSSLSVLGEKLKILNQTSNLGPIPAFGQAAFELNIRTNSLFDEFDDILTVEIGDQKFTKKVSVKPFLIFQTVPFVAAVFVLSLAFIYVLVLGGLIYRKRFLKVKKK